MYNKEPGKSIKRGLDIPLKDKKKGEPATPASVVDGGVGEGSGGSTSPVERAVGNIDPKNVNRGDRGNGNRKTEKDEMQQTTVLISLKNLALMDGYHDDHGASRTWIINKALTKFFDQLDT